MTSPITSFVAIQFVADADTPPESLPFAGQTFYIPPEYLTAIGSGPGNPGVIGANPGVRGYRVPGTNNWLMTPPIGNALRDSVLAIPGAHSWTVPASLLTYRNVAVTLVRDFGVPAPTVAQALTNLYNAAVTNANTSPPGG